MVSVDTEVVNDLKSKVNIADLILQYVALSRTGKNYIGLCPFHGEKTPSFNVNAEKDFIIVLVVVGLEMLLSS